MNMENYELVKDLDEGNHGVARLMRHKETKHLVAVKYMPRGHKQVKDYVEREIMNHRNLGHPNIIGFKEVVLTPTHIAIVLEYAAGGDLFDHICNRGRTCEDKARFYFQQIISGVSYCHYKEICHRDLKLENILVDGKMLKICDFGLSKSYLLHSRPNSLVGTPNYTAPEIISGKEYDGKLADVWSCGVILYVMLVGTFPFDEENNLNFKKIVNRIQAAEYKIPNDVHISQDCKDLISRIFVANPAKRITIKEIKSHPWFLKNLAEELKEEAQAVYYKKENSTCSQSTSDIRNIINMAKILPATSRPTPNHAKPLPATSNNAKPLPANSGPVLLDLENLSLRCRRGRSH